MNLGPFTLSNPAGLWFALLALPILALHVLRPRRVQAVVNAVYLWRRAATPVTAARPWQRLIPSWLLFAQLLAALLLALLIARPAQVTDEPLAEHTIFLIDASGSMRSTDVQATDGAPDRLAAAVERARELRRQLPVGGEASVVVVGDRARAVLTHSDDLAAFDEVTGAIEAGWGSGDFAGAFALAAGLDTGERPTRAVLIGDGGVASADLRLAPVGTGYERIGETDANRGITQLFVEPAESGLVARVTVTSFGGPEVEQVVRLDVDGRTVERRTVDLAPGDVVNLSVPVPPGERIEAFLESEDGLDLDDRVVATVARAPSVQVLHAGPDNPFLAAALAASPTFEVTRVDAIPDEIPEDVDVVLADRVALPADLVVPVFSIATPTLPDGIRAVGTVERPALTLVDGDSPLVRDLDLSQVLIASASQLEVDAAADVVIGAEGAPLLVRRRGTEATAIHLAFALDESTLPLEGAFPVLVDRILTDLADAVVPPSRVTVGADLPIDIRRSATVVDPEGTTTSLPAGSSIPRADRPGFWSIEQPGRPAVTVAVVPDRAESAIAPAPDLPFDAAFEGTRNAEARGEIPVLAPIVALLLLVLAVEWWLARRRLGVGPRQWRVATGLRLLVALALLAVLLTPTIDRRADRVATVFLVDGSDSIGVAGGIDIQDRITAALAERGDDDLAGVVVFGREARLSTLVGAEPDLGGARVVIDRTATDLSAALRLGAAALPEEARGRLVVLSDGRATTGDAAEEAERLVADGVPVDVHVIRPPTGADVAVSSVDVPALARRGDAVRIQARIESPVETPALVTLRSDDRVVDRVEVVLQPGDNTVTFTDTAGDLGVLRYQVEVDAAGDGVLANDVGYAAVPVEGAARVLVVEGRDGVADELVRVLDAAAIGHDVVAPTGVPAIDELSRYASVMLVDVDRRDLSDTQVGALTASVRELGRGMVVVGGTHAYALGGYRDSDLEEILPVISEITDPLRRQTVAEVLAVDTSGSMDACHCDEEGNNGLGGGNRIGGGVSKTAIARNAAARAIAALAATDEVGVLSVDATDRWLIDLQPRPSQQVVDDGLAGLVPDGPTFLDTALETSAAALRESEASLKHIILFSDGFTEPGGLAALVDQAEALLDEGITVSVVATGEGAAEDLRPIAEAGGGRFYPGRNLEQLPDIIVQEAILASRDFVTEGQFLPAITGNGPAVRELTESPNLLGYVATTPKPTARVDLTIGPDQDPLLASWQVGLGRVTAWTSDGSERWATPWAGWEGAPDFWSAVVKDTFPTSGQGGVTARLENGILDLRVEGVDAWDDGATATVRVATPDGEPLEIPLERLDGTTFAAQVAVADAGTYAIGATVREGGESVWAGVGLASRSYPAEYAPRPVAEDELTRIADVTGGRVDPPAEAAFSVENTVPGRRLIDLVPWLLLFAVLAWPIAVAVSRLAWRRGALATGAGSAAARASDTVRRLQQSRPRIDEPAGRGQAPSATGPPPGSETPPRTPPFSPPETPPSRPARPAASTPPAPFTGGRPSRPATPPPASPPDDVSGDPSDSTLGRLLDRKRNRPPD